MNDSDEEITKIAEFLVTKCGPDIPWHLSAFHPDHKMMDKERTSIQTLERCYNIGKKAGLKFVYLGNVRSNKVNTYCPKCDHLLIDRSGYVGKVVGMRGNQCENCSCTIYGEFWDSTLVYIIIQCRKCATTLIWTLSDSPSESLMSSSLRLETKQSQVICRMTSKHYMQC